MQRIKPLLKELKEAKRKDVEQGVLLEGLTKLIDSNKESMTTLVTSLNDSFKKEIPTAAGFTSAAETETRVTKLTKPVKVLIWS